MIATAEDVRAVRAVAINVAPEAVEPFIEDVEKQDVIPVIGADLYFNMETDRDNEDYTVLLRGGTYTDHCGKTKYIRGLIVAVAYLAYARMLIFGDIQYTAFGAVLKNAQYSQHVGETDKIRASDAARQIGRAALQDVADYLASRSQDACCRAPSVSRPKFIAIKKGKH